MATYTLSTGVGQQPTSDQSLGDYFDFLDAEAQKQGMTFLQYLDEEVKQMKKFSFYHSKEREYILTFRNGSFDMVLEDVKKLRVHLWNKIETDRIEQKIADIQQGQQPANPDVFKPATGPVATMQASGAAKPSTKLKDGTAWEIGKILLLMIIGYFIIQWLDI